jgi:hypothetical protein
MSEVLVDDEKLAYGLRRGIGHTRTIFSALPSRYRLRGSPCGLVSSAIYQYLQQSDLPSKLVISSPGLSFDPDMQHVFPLVGEENEDATVVDASYSQFLGYVGLHFNYEQFGKTKAFPKEEVIHFKLSEISMVTQWLTSVATQFQRKNFHPQNVWGMDAGAGPLETASAAYIFDSYSKIWSTMHLEEWKPPHYVLEDGKIVAGYLPKGSISIL